MVRALLFDFNGVLVDDEPIHFRLFQEVLAEEGIPLSEGEYYRHYLGFDDRGAFAAAFEAAGRRIEPPRIMRLVARKASYYQRLIQREGYPFFPGAVELVRSAAERGWMLGLVSGALREEVEGALRQAGLAGCFKALVTAEDVERSKPDPEGYRRALTALNSSPPLPERLLHPHEVVAIEDSLAGLQAAAAAGLRTLGVAHTSPPEELTGCDAQVESLEGLTTERLAALFTA